MAIKYLIPIFQNHVWNLLPPVIFIMVIENRDAYLHQTNKYIQNKFTWAHSTNYLESPFLFVVWIFNCHNCTITLYYIQLAFFDWKYIILWLIHIYSSSWKTLWHKVPSYLIPKNKPLPTNHFIEWNPPLLYLLQLYYILHGGIHSNSGRRQACLL